MTLCQEEDAFISSPAICLGRTHRITDVLRTKRDCNRGLCMLCNGGTIATAQNCNSQGLLKRFLLCINIVLETGHARGVFDVRYINVMLGILYRLKYICNIRFSRRRVYICT
jgi:hypothetical protein